MGTLGDIGVHIFDFVTFPAGNIKKISSMKLGKFVTYKTSRIQCIWPYDIYNQRWHMILNWGVPNKDGAINLILSLWLLLYRL